MNSTNRALNRIILLVTGLLALIVGGALIALVVVPDAASAYTDAAGATLPAVTGWLQTVAIPQTSTSWGSVGALAILAAVIVVLLVVVLRQGRGHHGTLLRESAASVGETVVDSSVAETALARYLDGRPDFVTSRVSTYRVRGTSVLKVSVTCRRGASPRAAVDVVQYGLEALDAQLGRRIPALIQISGGFRSRISSRSRTD